MALRAWPNISLRHPATLFLRVLCLLSFFQYPPHPAGPADPAYLVNFQLNEISKVVLAYAMS
jgi:hypothetical protein